MSCDKIVWLHSGGAFNKNPDLDIGNYPSEFAIATPTMNNLFDNVTPQETADGLIDYRCFYIFNKNSDQNIESIVLDLNPPQCSDGSSILFGSKFADDIQQITVLGTPDEVGYVIFDTEFGTPFTVEWGGSIATFASNFQTKIQLLPWCSAVTTGSVTANSFQVTFTGDVGNRLVKNIRVVQNNLLNKDWSTYNTVTYSGSDSFNGTGDLEIKTTRVINDEYVEPSGVLRVYDIDTGLYKPISYTSYMSNIFVLSSPITINIPGLLAATPTPVLISDIILAEPWGWLEAPIIDHTAEICIEKIQYGSPINSIAVPITSDTDTPDASFSGSSTPIGILRPHEGFFVWIKRITSAGTSPMANDCFHLTLTGVATSWPPTQ